MKSHIITEETTGARLCKDGLFRTFACFGTPPETVKVWTSKAWARKKQDSLHSQGVGVAIVTLSRDWTMDAAGHISRK